MPCHSFLFLIEAKIRSHANTEHLPSNSWFICPQLKYNYFNNDKLTTKTQFWIGNLEFLIIFHVFFFKSNYNLREIRSQVFFFSFIYLFFQLYSEFFLYCRSCWFYHEWIFSVLYQKTKENKNGSYFNKQRQSQPVNNYFFFKEKFVDSNNLELFLEQKCHFEHVY